jgi:hypothetical protein
MARAHSGSAFTIQHKTIMRRLGPFAIATGMAVLAACAELRTDSNAENGGG